MTKNTPASITPHDIPMDQDEVIVIVIDDSRSIPSVIHNKTHNIVRIERKGKDILFIYLDDDCRLYHTPKIGWSFSIDYEGSQRLPFAPQVFLPYKQE